VNARSVSRALPWATCAATTAFVGATVALEAASRVRGSHGQIDLFLAPILAMLIGFAVVGAMIVTRHPGNRIGWVFMIAGGEFALFQLSAQFGTYALLVRHGDVPGGIWAAELSDAMFAPSVVLVLVFVFLLFPDGRPPAPRWRLVGWVAGISCAITTLSSFVHPGTLSDPFGEYRNPIGVEAAAAADTIGVIAFLVMLACWPAAMAAMVVRYRRAGPLQRAQTRWFTVASLLVPASVLIAAVGGPLEPIGMGAWWLAVIGLPVSIGVAILRHRMYDIDVIIRKTLVYVLLVAPLAALYLVLIAVLGTASRAATGQSGVLAVTLSTLAVAAAFQPLRRRVQTAVDRRFYRSKYDTARTLDAFSGRLRQQIDLEALQGEVLGVVQETLAPASATLWLRPGAGRS